MCCVPSGIKTLGHWRYNMKSMSCGNVPEFNVLEHRTLKKDQLFYKCTNVLNVPLKGEIAQRTACALCALSFSLWDKKLRS